MALVALHTGKRGHSEDRKHLATTKVQLVWGWLLVPIYVRGKGENTRREVSHKML